MSKIYNTLLCLCIAASILLISIECFALPRGPTIYYYYQPGDYAAPFDVVKEELKIWARHESHIFKATSKFILRVSPIASKCPGIFNTEQGQMQFWCLWSESLKANLDKNNRVIHFLVQPLLSKNFQFAVGGIAFRSCFKNLHPNNSAGGFAVSNFVLQQRDGTSRLLPSEAAAIHEDGHTAYGLVHDDPESCDLMNTNFNVLECSKLAPPEKWKLSEKSRKQVKNCLNFRSHKNGYRI